MKIAESALLSLFTKKMKSATSLTTPSTGLSDIQFSILNVLESLILKDQTKYNNPAQDEVRATFYGRHTALNYHNKNMITTQDDTKSYETNDD